MGSPQKKQKHSFAWSCPESFAHTRLSQWNAPGTLHNQFKVDVWFFPTISYGRGCSWGFQIPFWGGTVQLVRSRVPLALPTTFIVLSFFGLHSWTFALPYLHCQTGAVALLKKEQCTQTIYWHFDFLNESSLCRHVYEYDVYVHKLKGA